MLDPVHHTQGVAAGDPRAGGADRARLVDHVLVDLDPALVRVDDVVLVARGRDGAVEATEPAEARDEEDHLAPLAALLAGLGERAPVAGRHREPVQCLADHRGVDPSPRA